MSMVGQLEGLLLAAMCLLACGPRLPASDAGEGSTSVNETVGGSSETGGASTETVGSTTETDTGTETETDTGTDDGSGVCGDGVLDPGEECDDGNLVDDDGCSARCLGPMLLFCSGIQVYECGDGLDNDGDGLFDTDDLECNSPCDDTEDDLCENLPGGGSNECRIECAFDGNNGIGDDQCESDWGCYPPDQMMCGLLPPDAPECSFVEPNCVDFCVPLLPNGCDCFGCCEIDGQTVKLNSFTWINNNQSIGCCDLDNLDYCASCEMRLDCFNPCEPDSCELCFAQTIDDLPVSCAEPSCPPNHSSCASKDDCPSGWFCQTGCCKPAP